MPPRPPARTGPWLFLLLTLLPAIASAQDPAPSTPHSPGAHAVITAEQLEATAPLSVSEILALQAGLHLLTQDPMGLRLHLGPRGQQPRGSRNLLLLEDGLPMLALPYGGGTSLYAPPVERIQQIEILKGAAAILHGPRALGGAINFVGLRPPAERQLQTNAGLGSSGLWEFGARYGDAHGPIAYLLQLQQRHFRGPRQLQMRRTDVLSRLELDLGAGQSLRLGFDLYDEISAQSPLGLTTPQFESDPYAQFARNDVAPLRRYALSARHDVELSEKLELRTSVYARQLHLRWSRQRFDRQRKPSVDYERVLDGEGNLNPAQEPQDGSGVFFRRATESSRQQQRSLGLQQRLVLRGQQADWLQTTTKIGWRLHYEEMTRQQLVGEWAASLSGDLRQDEVGEGYALAFYLQPSMLFFRRLTIAPGLRGELYWTRRAVMRVDGVDLRPPGIGWAAISGVIPGISAAYKHSAQMETFASVYRGFAPPTIQQAVRSDGSARVLQPEYSWNSELGLRARPAEATQLQLSGFYMTSYNLILAPEEFGADANSSPTNDHASHQAGVELSGQVDLASSRASFSFPLRLQATFLPLAAHRRSPNAELIGARLPYAPAFDVALQLGYRDRRGLHAQITSRLLGPQFSDRFETDEPSADGTVGSIPTRVGLDLTLGYDHEPWGLGVFLLGKNLLGSPQVIMRHPDGIQPGGFLQVFGGLRWRAL